MDVLSTSGTNITSLLNGKTTANDNSIELSSNWMAVESTKKIENVISYDLATNCPSRMTLDDIVDETRCLEIKPNVDDNTGCTIDIKMKNNHKIIRIGVVSEASVLEIFRDSGEYATTAFAELIDEFEDASVYYAEVTFERPTTEASIKFKRIKNSNRTSMFLYGIKVIIEETTAGNSPEQLLDFNLINDLLKMTMGARQKRQGNNDNASHNNRGTDDIFLNALDYRKNKSMDNNNEKQRVAETCITHADSEENSSTNNKAFEALINTQLQQMELRIMNRIDLVEANTNKKLNDIMSILETIKNNQS